MKDKEFARKLRKVNFSLVPGRGPILLDVRDPSQDKRLSIDLPLLARSKFGLPLLRISSVLCLLVPLWVFSVLPACVCQLKSTYTLWG